MLRFDVKAHQAVRLLDRVLQDTLRRRAEWNLNRRRNLFERAAARADLSFDVLVGQMRAREQIFGYSLGPANQSEKNMFDFNGGPAKPGGFKARVE